MTEYKNMNCEYDMSCTQCMLVLDSIADSLPVEINSSENILCMWATKILHTADPQEKVWKYPLTCSD